MHRHRLEKEEHLIEAFKYFDKDRSGFVKSSVLIFISFFTQIVTTTILNIKLSSKF